MSRFHLPALCLAVAALAGCNNDDHNIVGGPADPQSAELANAAAVELPPMIEASHTYRCKDNSLVYIDFFNNKTTANLREEQNGPATVLTAAEPGQPYQSGEYSVTGAGGDKTVTVSRPGKGSQACKV